MLINCLCFSIKDGESRFNEYPPTIYNTHCEIGTFQFIPFNRTSELPKYAVKFEVDADRSTYIGRLNGDDDQLCQIIFRGTELTEIKPIPYDDDIDLMSNHENEFEVCRLECSKHFSFKITSFYRFLQERVSNGRTTKNWIKNLNTTVFTYGPMNTDTLLCKKRKDMANIF